MSTTARHRLLIAVRLQDRELVLSALGGEFEPVIVYALADALRQLRSDIAMVICGIHFDEGRMFDLLQAAKADPATAGIPFIPVLNASNTHSEGIRHGIRSAAMSLGADDFICLRDLHDRDQQEQVFEPLRQRIRDALGQSPVNAPPADRAGSPSEPASRL